MNECQNIWTYFSDSKIESNITFSLCLKFIISFPRRNLLNVLKDILASVEKLIKITLIKIEAGRQIFWSKMPFYGFGEQGYHIFPLNENFRKHK